MENVDNELLVNISKDYEIKEGAYNLRKNGKGIERRLTDNVDIQTKENVDGINIYVKDNTQFDVIHIPVIITQGGINDKVYNDFYIGKNAHVIIIAGCGIHNDCNEDSQHDGIHRFFLKSGANVKYIENHYGQGSGEGKRILNPVTEIYMEKNSRLEMETMQIKGVDSTQRITKAELEENASLAVVEKILTHGKQTATTEFIVNLNGKNSSAHVVSRSVATENSYQEFSSKIFGNVECFAHVECDAILQDAGKVKAIPEIIANSVDANLIHEAAIGKIAGEQLIKLMTLGLSQKDAEQEILNGFLK